MKKTILNNLVIFLSCVILSALINNANAELFSKSNVGTTCAQFLKIGCGARAIGMGEAYCGVADEASAIYWNPAGLSQVTRPNLTLMHAVWLESISYDFFAYAHPTKYGIFGIGANYLSMQPMDKLDDWGEKYGDFSPSDLAFNIAYAFDYKGLTVGANLKYIQQHIDNEIDDAKGYALDLGYLYRFPTNKTTVGVAIRNLGTQMKFVSDSYDLPLSIRAGISHKIKENLIVALDGEAPIDNTPNLHTGIEYSLKDLPVACRLGFKTNTINDLDALSGLSAGMGFFLGCLRLDYAWVPYGDLGNTHRASINMSFGSEKKAANKKVTKKKAQPKKTVASKKKNIKKY